MSFVLMPDGTIVTLWIATEALADGSGVPGRATAVPSHVSRQNAPHTMRNKTTTTADALRALSSLPLAISEFLVIAGFSALGTVIEQNKGTQWYVTNYPVDDPALGFIDYPLIRRKEMNALLHLISPHLVGVLWRHNLLFRHVAHTNYLQLAVLLAVNDLSNSCTLTAACLAPVCVTRRCGHHDDCVAECLDEQVTFSSRKDSQGEDGVAIAKHSVLCAC